MECGSLVLLDTASKWLGESRLTKPTGASGGKPENRVRAPFVRPMEDETDDESRERFVETFDESLAEATDLSAVN